MPEGPEVAILARQIGDIITGNLITNVKSNKFKAVVPVFENNTVKLVKSHGKVLVFEFEDAKIVTCHLALAGHWCVTDLISDLGSKSKSVQFSFECEGRLFYYEDKMSLGKIEAVSDWESPKTPDVLTCTADSVLSVLSSHKRAVIANALINQQYIAGIGNYLRADIMFKAGVFPRTKISDLGESELRKISVSCVKVSRDSYKKGGSKKYSDLYGEKGKYEFAVYQKEKDPDGNPVEKIKMGGRTVYYSPEKQKE